ncbi:MAG: SRPBCC family protein [Alphaproteobacteria bacterium]|nr:SRPBCC family protein [Alphaproteobacteria bacterium]
MREWRLEIEIDRPVAEVFAFAIDPRNSPKWIDSFEEEKTSAWPIAVGSVYSNRGKVGEWRDYTVTAFEENKVFELTSADGFYTVHYTFEETAANGTRMLYHERVTQGELEAPFELATLEKLKALLEAP